MFGAVRRPRRFHLCVRGTRRGDRPEALRLALESLDSFQPVCAFSCDDGRWVWPLAARVAHEMGQFDVECSLLEMFERVPAMERAPMQRAEAALIRARLASVGRAAEADADALFDAAVSGLREHSTPYHLAHGLIDQADHLRGQGEPADGLVDEAHAIAERLRCAPLLERSSEPSPEPV